MKRIDIEICTKLLNEDNSIVAAGTYPNFVVSDDAIVIGNPAVIHHKH